MWSVYFSPNTFGIQHLMPNIMANLNNTLYVNFLLHTLKHNPMNTLPMKSFTILSHFSYFQNMNFMYHRSPANLHLWNLHSFQILVILLTVSMIEEKIHNSGRCKLSSHFDSIRFKRNNHERLNEFNWMVFMCDILTLDVIYLLFRYFFGNECCWHFRNRPWRPFHMFVKRLRKKTQLHRNRLICTSFSRKNVSKWLYRLKRILWKFQSGNWYVKILSSTKNHSNSMQNFDSN